MDWLSGGDIFEQIVDDSLHQETQADALSVSLTAAVIERMDTPGELDFGGSEFQLGERSLVEAQKRDETDDYGWWELSEGQYVLELNETVQLQNHQVATLQPHDHLIWNGCTHPTLTLSADDSSSRLMVPLHVPASGLAIKENARVSLLRVEES